MHILLALVFALQDAALLAGNEKAKPNSMETQNPKMLRAYWRVPGKLPMAVETFHSSKVEDMYTIWFVENSREFGYKPGPSYGEDSGATLKKSEIDRIKQMSEGRYAVLGRMNLDYEDVVVEPDDLPVLIDECDRLGAAQPEMLPVLENLRSLAEKALNKKKSLYFLAP